MTTLSAQTATSVTTTNHGTLRLRPSSLQPSPATPGFPITSDLTSSPFYDVQAGLQDITSIQACGRYRRVRDPIDPNTFWVNPQGKSFALMKQSDLVRCSVEDGRMVEGLVPTHASASSIHSQLYKSLGRGPQGIEAVVHVHGPHTKAFSSLGRTLEMISQDVCVYHDEQVLVFFGGAMFDNKEGERIAQAVRKDKNIAVLQNHGIVALGRLSIDEAAWWQINFEMCCQAQLLADAARRTGDPIVEAGPEEIASTKREMGSSEMGWYSLAAYVEEEEYHSGGRHKL